MCNVLLTSESRSTLALDRADEMWFTSGVKVSFAAHRILSYIVLLDMGQLPTNIQHRIMKRTAELQYVLQIVSMFCHYFFVAERDLINQRLERKHFLVFGTQACTRRLDEAHHYLT